MPRPTPAQWLLAFGIYAYLVTVGLATWLLARQRRAAGLSGDYGPLLMWQASIYALWVPIAWLVWRLFRRSGVTPRTLLTFLLGALLAVPAHALAAGLIDTSFSPLAAQAGLLRVAEQRVPVDMLIYSAFGALALAAAFHRRAIEQQAAARDLAAALAAARAALDRAAPAERLTVSVGSTRMLVEPAAVEWFGSAGNYVLVNWEGREGLIRATLQSLGQQLDPQLFARSHRGTIVNLARVEGAAPLADGSWRLLMAGGAELIVSRTYRDNILARLSGARPAQPPLGP